VALQDVLDKMAKGQYGQEVPRYNAFEQAPALAQAIINWQKAQRAEPYLRTLQEYGSQWATATPERQAELNKAASDARAAFLEAGGSPYDLPKSVWGSNPALGFQTGEDQFIPPFYGSNLTNRQRAIIAEQQMKQQEALNKALLNALNMRLKESQITGIDPETGQPTWQRQYQERRLAQSGQVRPGSAQARTQVRGELFGKVKSAADRLWSDVQKGENDLRNGFEDLKAAILADAPEYMGKGATRSDIYDALNYTADLLGLPRPYQNTTAMPGGTIDLSGNPQ